YNNTGASDAQNAAGVWDSNFVGVWHLEEQSGTTHDDSTGVHDGVRNNNVYYPGEGRSAQTFDGSRDYVHIADADALSLGSGGTDSAFSMTAWVVNDNGGSEYAEIVCRAGDDPDPFEYEFYLWNGRLTISLYDNALDYVGVWAGSPIPAGWHHVTVTYDGSNSDTGMKLFTDGAEEGTSAVNSGRYDGMSNTDLPLRIGGWHTGDDDFTGEIDEVRISSTVRSADWIEASFLSQNGTFAFNTFGSEEAVP
ncbi:MAG: LamG domain-containing protein, partial [Deltaproteobacteria bacterium]|nr:LamG domain-containing protein [Deltaproteobacteria bacterium]